MNAESSDMTKVYSISKRELRKHKRNVSKGSMSMSPKKLQDFNAKKASKTSSRALTPAFRHQSQVSDEIEEENDAISQGHLLEEESVGDLGDLMKKEEKLYETEDNKEKLEKKERKRMGKQVNTYYEFLDR